MIFIAYFPVLIHPYEVLVATSFKSMFVLIAAYNDSATSIIEYCISLHCLIDYINTMLSTKKFSASTRRQPLSGLHSIIQQYFVVIFPCLFVPYVSERTCTTFTALTFFFKSNLHWHMAVQNTSYFWSFHCSSRCYV